MTEFTKDELRFKLKAKEIQADNLRNQINYQKKTLKYLDIEIMLLKNKIVEINI